MGNLQTRFAILALSSATLAGCSTSLPPGAPAYSPVIDPSDFSANIDNPYMPLQPGTTFVYDGQTEKGNEHNEVFVTDQTKIVMGIPCVVVQDTVLVDGTLEEATMDWYAQDKEGNVWYFGEDSKEYQNGQAVSTEGSWEAGVDGALPGIVMEAHPKEGDTYRQEFSKGQAEDWASVLATTETSSVPWGSYENVLVTNEWSGLDNPPVYEHKYYAPGIGFVMTKYVDGGFELSLTKVRQPSP